MFHEKIIAWQTVIPTSGDMQYIMWWNVAHLSQYPAEKVVVTGKGFTHKHLCCGARVKEAFISCLKEALVRVKAWFQQLIQELSKYSSTINASFIQPMSIEQMNSDSLL